MNICLFGPIRLNHADQPVIHFRSNPERALLTYLAMEFGRPSSRESICALIWPELSESNARNNLRVTLSRLRQSLSGDIDIISVSGKIIELDPFADIWIDAHVFTALIETSQKHTHLPAGDCPECVKRYHQAAELFKGEFAEGLALADNIPFTEWLVLKRELLHRQALDLFHTLADYHLRRGELYQAQGYAQRQLELEPWREEAHRQLMICFARSEKKSVALAQYEQCKKILEDELGVEPSFETQALYERIKRSRGRKRPILPTVPTNFVGRDQEQAEIIHSLSKPECRLLTLIGMGGVGKTRLAAQIASQFEYAFLDGTIYVPLSVIQSPERVLDAIADALGFAFADSNNPLEQLLNHLENKEYLIVLDNFEHVLAAVPQLVKIWECCPGIKILVTSRERLGLEQEYLVELGGLPASLDTDPAIDMLSMCIRRVNPSFDPSEQNLEEMVKLCRQVEGMPLALELAAPMTRVLSIQEIISGIQIFVLPSLDAVFERSWGLLPPREKTGLMKLSIFNTPFTRESSQEVAQVDTAMLTSLVDKSLIRRVNFITEVKHERESIYFDFHPLLKQFASQKLKEEPETLSHSKERHANYFLDMMDRLYKNLLTPDENQAIKKIHNLHEDIVVSMKWGCTHARHESIRRGLHFHLHYFEYYAKFRLGKYFFGEMVEILREVRRQQQYPSHELDQILARAIAYYGWHLMHLEDSQEAIKHANEAIQLARESQDKVVEAAAMLAMGVIYQVLGDLDQSNQYFESALQPARQAMGQLEGRWFVAGLYGNLGMNATIQSNFDLALKLFNSAMEFQRQIGQVYAIAQTHLDYGRLYMKMDRYEQAHVSLFEGLELAESHNYQWMKASGLVALGDLAFKQEDWETAVRYYQESFDSIEEFGRKGLLEETRKKLQEASRLAQSKGKMG